MMTPNDYPANVYMVAPYDPHLLYYPAAMPEVIVQSIPVSADFVPFLIGKQGKAIKRLSNVSIFLNFILSLLISIAIQHCDQGFRDWE